MKERRKKRIRNTIRKHRSRLNSGLGVRSFSRAPQNSQTQSLKLFTRVIRERIVKSIFECAQLHNFMQCFGPVGPSSGIQCWTLHKTDNAKCLQLLLEHRNGRLESIVCSVRCVSVCYDDVAKITKNALPWFQANE